MTDFYKGIDPADIAKVDQSLATIRAGVQLLEDGIRKVIESGKMDDVEILSGLTPALINRFNADPVSLGTIAALLLIEKAKAQS